MNSLLDLIKREKPEHVAVCFDKGGSASRSEIFPDYKANRLETPEAITLGIPYIKNSKCNGHFVNRNRRI